jgi:hypothetical protein
MLKARIDLHSSFVRSLITALLPNCEWRLRVGITAKADGHPTITSLLRQ